MAIELRDDLVALEQRALEEGRKARAIAYTAEGWAPWLEAAQAVDGAITEFAVASKQNRLAVAMAVRRAALGETGA